MGLDVYVKRCEDLAAAKALEEQYDRESEAIWEAVAPGVKYEQLTDAQKDSARDQTKALAERLGLDEWGAHPGIETIEFPSEKYPDHYFKVGYFRSSYNDSGINNVLRRLSLPGLSYIMNPDDEGEIVPDWKACAERAAEVLAKLRACDNSYDVMEIAGNPFGQPREAKSASDARAIYAEHAARKTNSEMRAYSNLQGEFFLEGVKVRAFIHGASEFMGRNRETLYVVYDKEDAAWYEQALEIVIETCEYVLTRPDPQNYYMSWSG
jgi:hypothetical protein